MKPEVWSEVSRIVSQASALGGAEAEDWAEEGTSRA